ncbi:hypothetical protein MMC07_000693 [Pseudocyphellaria aurata]|nr:hypothetical protein [Pseudocyphellaria aurata]
MKHDDAGAPIDETSRESVNLNLDLDAEKHPLATLLRRVSIFPGRITRTASVFSEMAALTRAYGLIVATPSKGVGGIRFLVFGSSALRYILHQIHAYVLPSSTSSRRRKLLLTEDIPLSAQLWEMTLNLIYVESAWSVLQVEHDCISLYGRHSTHKHIENLVRNDVPLPRTTPKVSRRRILLEDDSPGHAAVPMARKTSSDSDKTPIVGSDLDLAQKGSHSEGPSSQMTKYAW